LEERCFALKKISHVQLTHYKGNAIAGTFLKLRENTLIFYQKKGFLKEIDNDNVDHFL